MQNLEYNDCVVFLLAKAYQRAHGILKEKLKKHGLTPVQQLILAALELQDGAPAGEIGKSLVLDSATLSGTLDRLADKGWVAKRSDAHDRRIVRVFLTERAKGALEEIAQARRQTNEQVLKALSLEESVLLKRLLKDLT